MCLDAVDNPTQLWNLTSQKKFNGSSIREGLELVGWTLRNEMRCHGTPGTGKASSSSEEEVSSQWKFSGKGPGWAWVTATKAGQDLDQRLVV